MLVEEVPLEHVPNLCTRFGLIELEGGPVGGFEDRSLHVSPDPGGVGNDSDLVEPCLGDSLGAPEGCSDLGLLLDEKGVESSLGAPFGGHSSGGSSADDQDLTGDPLDSVDDLGLHCLAPLGSRVSACTGQSPTQIPHLVHLSLNSST